jgi:hypothetical protein
MNNETERIEKLCNDILNIIPEDIKIDFTFEKVENLNKNLYHFYISNLKYYLEDLRFKKFSKILKKKYKDIYFIFCYRDDIFQ